jgi:hypothetical protein
VGVNETDFAQALFGESVDAIPTCQWCGTVIDGGVYCNDCDPYTN